MNRFAPLPPASATAVNNPGAGLSGHLWARSEGHGGSTRHVTGIWFGALAAHPGRPLAGLHGSMLVEADGSFHYRLHQASPVQLLDHAGRGSIEESFTLNISDSAGTSCVAGLTIAIRASGDSLQLAASFVVQSTVTERYCLTAQNGLALLCMETGQHFEMCRLDTPLSAVARSHSREFFGVGGQHLLRMDPINGNTIWIGILAQPRRIVALDAAPDGMLYGIDVQGDLYRIQPANGSTTLLVRLGLPSLYKGAVAHIGDRLLWTAADNRLHAYDLNSGACTVALPELQPTAPAVLHERVLAMMPAIDGGLFVATTDGVLRIDLCTGDWVDTGVRGRLGELMDTGIPSGPVWGGREPGHPAANEVCVGWSGCWPMLQPH